MATDGVWDIFNPSSLSRWINEKRYDNHEVLPDWEKRSFGLTPFERKTLVFHTVMNSKELQQIISQLLTETRDRWIEVYENRLHKEYNVHQGMRSQIANLF